MKTNISRGNVKVGAIPNMSLTPRRSCSVEACATCYLDGCYANKSYRQYPNVRKAWDENTELALSDIPTMETDLRSYFAKKNAPRFFRVHVAGDFITREYAEMWIRVSAASPDTNFVAFTKQFDIIRGLKFPENFSIVLSDWVGITIPEDLRAIYSVAWIDDGRECIPEKAMECSGRCDTCGACWGLAKAGIDVKFRKH